MQAVDYTFKFVLVGNSQTGKSSLLSRFAKNVFSEDFKQTIGLELFSKIIDYHGQVVKLQIWDSTGQARCKSTASVYYKGIKGIILVYDITDRQSFTALQATWLNEVNQYAGPKTLKILIGNKSDLENNRSVKIEEGNDLASYLGVKFLETSAKESINVDQAFNTLAKEIISNGIMEKKETKG